MEIVVKFLEAMQVLLLATTVLFLVIGCGMAIAGIATRKLWLVAIGLVLAFGQFVSPWLSNRNSGHAIEARREFVRDMPKTPIPANYPRRIVLEGDITPDPPTWLIAAGYADEVDLEGRRLVGTGDIADCRRAALAFLNPNGPTVREQFGTNAYKVLQTCSRFAGPYAPNADAIVLRVDNRTTLYDRENARHHGAPRAIQVSLRRNGKEVLAHYDEMPILAYPKSATRLLPDGYEYPCKRFAYLQIVANLLDAARQPAQSDALLQRGGVRYREYDNCIASIAPQLRTDASATPPI